MNWIFKPEGFLQFENNTQKAIISIEQKKNFSGEVGENVLILEKRINGWEFIAQYRIAIIERKDLDNNLKQITLTLDLIQQFKEEKLLDDYIYSLKRITNYSNPIRHFSRKYNRLTNTEFEAIVEDKIYLKRTILGTVLNAMHYQHQKEFIAFIANVAPELLSGKVDIDKALNLLFDYLEFAIIKPAQYLKEGAELLKTIVEDQDFTQIGFAFNLDKLKPENIQLIDPQVTVINEYLIDLLNFNGELFKSEGFDLQDNLKFRALFRNSPLPITIN